MKLLTLFEAYAKAVRQMDQHAGYRDKHFLGIMVNSDKDAIQYRRRLRMSQKLYARIYWQIKASDGK